MTSHSPLCEAIRLGHNLGHLLRQKDILRRITHLCHRCKLSPLAVGAEEIKVDAIQALVDHTPQDKWAEQLNIISLRMVATAHGSGIGMTTVLTAMEMKVGKEQFARILSEDHGHTPGPLANLVFMQIPHFQPRQLVMTCYLAKIFINFGADVNTPREISVLHLACMGCNPSLIKVLLHSGAEINNVHNCEATPLDIAKGEVTGCGQLDLDLRKEVAQVLIDAGGKSYKEIAPPEPKKKRRRRRASSDPVPAPEVPKPIRKKKDTSKLFCSTSGLYKCMCTCPRCTKRRERC
jgi:hypothetical protein